MHAQLSYVILFLMPSFAQRLAIMNPLSVPGPPPPLHPGAYAFGVVDTLSW